MTFTHHTGNRYIVTGVTVRGERFRMSYDNPHMALAINLYRGRVWHMHDGKRTLIQRVWN